jgi:hypothetical protein
MPRKIRVGRGESHQHVTASSAGAITASCGPSARAALRSNPGVSAGQSAPISTSAALSPSAASNACAMRSPRSRPRWTWSVAPNSTAQRAKNGWLESGAHQSSTGPHAGFARRRERVAQELAVQACRALGAEHRNEPRLDLAGDRRLRETAMRVDSGRGALDVIAAREPVRSAPNA